MKSTGMVMREWRKYRAMEFNAINRSQPALVWRHTDWLISREYRTGYGIGWKRAMG